MLLLLILASLFLANMRASAGEVLTPAEAAKLEGTGKEVTVEFVVKSCHPVLPDGKHFRLFSEHSFRDKGAFVVHLTDKAVTKLAGKDLDKLFMGKKIRVTGEVGPTVFSSIAENRPGIFVDVPPSIQEVKSVGNRGNGNIE